MTDFKPGDIVLHKLANLRMKVLRVSESVATCDHIDEPEELVSSHVLGDYVNRKPRSVCGVDNLELIEQTTDKQLTLQL